MSPARKGFWTVFGTVALVGAGVTVASTAAGPDETPVRVAAATEAASADDAGEAARPARRATTTTTIAALTTTTATPTTTAPAPTTTVAPPPPPPPPTTAPAPAPKPAPTTTKAPPPPPPPPPPTTQPAPKPSTPQHGARNVGCEQYMYDQINAARGRVGRPALAFDSVIQYIAVDWSDHMAGTQVLAHNPNYGDQILRHRDYRSAGENVGRGHDQGGLFQAFMNSTGHRQNIESGSYSHVTVGCVTDGSGQLWVTQNFWG